MANRSLPIDTLRGLACVLLVTYHVIGADARSGLRVPDGEPLRLFNDALAYVRMPLFSFLSGFVYAWRPFDGDSSRFVTGKIRRLLIPMLLVGTFFALLQSAVPGTNRADYDWSMLHILPVAHFWFLESLFLVFMLVAALEQLGWLRREAAFLVVWLTAAVVHFVNPFPVHLGLLGAVYLLPYFLLGVWCNRFGARYARRPVLAAGVTIAVAAALIAIGEGKGFPSRNAFAALLIGASVCVLLEKLRPEAKWLAWIGIHSFAIYMLHPIFSAASRIFLDAIVELPDLVLLGVGLIAGIGGAIVAEAVLRRVPVLGAWALGEPPGRGRADP